MNFCVFWSGLLIISKKVHTFSLILLDFRPESSHFFLKNFLTDLIVHFSRWPRSDTYLFSSQISIIDHLWSKKAEIKQILTKFTRNLADFCWKSTQNASFQSFFKNADYFQKSSHFKKFILKPPPCQQNPNNTWGRYWSGPQKESKQS